MADWTWKQAVAECILDVVNRTGTPRFLLADVYRYEESLQRRFPRNRTVRNKTRQILQQLRDQSLIEFRGTGRYVLNLGHESVEWESPSFIRPGSARVTRRRVLRNVRLRDTLLATEIKRRYANVCQVCRQPVRLTDTRSYAEGHHLRPLGRPHNGPDQPGNILVLCPNHHKMFDRGAATVYPKTLRLGHLVRNVFTPGACLYVESWHQLSLECIEYHHTQIFSRRAV